MPRLQFWRFDNGGIRDLLSASDHLARSHLEPTLLDLVYLRVSQLTRCNDCVNAHAQDAISHGVAPTTVEKLAVWRETPSFDQRQRAALAWTEAVTLLPGHEVPDTEYARAKGQFNDEELANLTIAIVAINGWNRLNIAFQTPAGNYQPRKR